MVSAMYPVLYATIALLGGHEFFVKSGGRHQVDGDCGRKLDCGQCFEMGGMESVGF
jgi:hypothetical protein